MNQPPLNPDGVLNAMDTLMAETDADARATEWARKVTTRVLEGYFAAALPEVTSVEELEALPVGAVVYASNHIGPAEKFAVGWMGCGNNAAWSSALLARDGLPARVLYRPSEQP